MELETTLPKYVCHKEVEAFKIGEIEPEGDCLVIKSSDLKQQISIAMTTDWVERHKPEVGGYFVEYKDGYKSFSPSEAFEEGYTLKETGESPGPFGLLHLGRGTFGQAVEAMKEGKRVARAGWKRAQYKQSQNLPQTI